MAYHELINKLLTEIVSNLKDTFSVKIKFLETFGDTIWDDRNHKTSHELFPIEITLNNISYHFNLLAPDSIRRHQASDIRDITYISKDLTKERKHQRYTYVSDKEFSKQYLSFSNIYSVILSEPSIKEYLDNQYKSIINTINEEFKGIDYSYSYFIIAGKLHLRLQFKDSSLKITTPLFKESTSLFKINLATKLMIFTVNDKRHSKAVYANKDIVKKIKSIRKDNQLKDEISKLKIKNHSPEFREISLIGERILTLGKSVTEYEFKDLENYYQNIVTFKNHFYMEINNIENKLNNFKELKYPKQLVSAQLENLNKVKILYNNKIQETQKIFLKDSDSFLIKE